MAAALPGVFLLCSGCSISHDVSVGTPEHETKSIALDKAEIVAVNLRMGVGELKIDSGTSQLMEGSFTYSTPSWKPEVDYRGGSSRGGSGGGSAGGSGGNTSRSDLDDEIPF